MAKPKKEPESLKDLLKRIQDKWAKAKVPNSVRALADLEAIESQATAEGGELEGLEDCKAALEEYRDLERSDYDSNEEYAEGKTEAWGSFAECLGDLEVEEELVAAPPAQSPVPISAEEFKRRLGDLWPQAEALVAHPTVGTIRDLKEQASELLKDIATAMPRSGRERARYEIIHSKVFESIEALDNMQVALGVVAKETLPRRVESAQHSVQVIGSLLLENMEIKPKEAAIPPIPKPPAKKPPIKAPPTKKPPVTAPPPGPLPPLPPSPEGVTVSPGGFQRPFGAAQFILDYLAGRGAKWEAETIDPEDGSPQSDILREYKRALHDKWAQEMVDKEDEAKIRKNLGIYSLTEASERKAYWLACYPLARCRMRYHSFLIYFGMLKRLGWVAATGETEASKAQERMALAPGEEDRQTGWPMVYYRVTPTGLAIDTEDVKPNPLMSLYTTIAGVPAEEYFRLHRAKRKAVKCK